MRVDKDEFRETYVRCHTDIIIGQSMVYHKDDITTAKKLRQYDTLRAISEGRVGISRTGSLADAMPYREIELRIAKLEESRADRFRRFERPTCLPVLGCTYTARYRFRSSRAERALRPPLPHADR